MAKLGEDMQIRFFVENSVESVDTYDSGANDNFLYKLKVRTLQ
jgi:hypothetical protein